MVVNGFDTCSAHILMTLCLEQLQHTVSRVLKGLGLSFSQNIIFHPSTEHALLFFFFFSLLLYNCDATSWKGGARLDSCDCQSSIHFSLERWAGHAEARPQ